LPGNPARKESIMERSHESAAALAHGAVGPLADHLDAFVASLTSQQYAPAVVYIKALHALAFDRWLAKRRLTLADLGAIHIERFERRRRRRHRSICAETRRRERYDVSEVLQFLRARGVCRTADVDPIPADAFVVGFEQHLQQHQGLAVTTIETYSRFASKFLHERFGTGQVDLRALRPIDPIEFVRSEAKRMQPSALKGVANAMRSFLRYGQYRGEVAPELVAAVPAVATWATTPPLPRAISPDNAQRAIDSCDLRTSLGLRDRAVLLLLARLGLRAHEIIALQLQDCDWDAGCLRVRGKGGRECLLPMPADVGEAIAAYLERGRPASADRHLFLRSLAPIRGFLPGSFAIGSIVRYALQRAKIKAPHTGSHQFRHALAVGMLERGASLAEIGEVLRHRSPQTTSIYARVDVSALRSLALPWPGDAR
jgi:site-specific recombinase XerD